MELVSPTKEQTPILLNTNDKDEQESDSDVSSSNNLLYDIEPILSSSQSELDLSIAFQSINEMSTLSLTALDSQQELTTDYDIEDILLTPTHTTSDNESVLYLRLSDELNINEATLDSDLDRIDR
jgi:hypothetical protein